MPKQSKRKSSKKWKMPKIKKRKRSNWRINAKSFYLTYQCPRDAIVYFFKTMFPMFDIICVMEEVNSKRPDTIHFHVFIQITNPTTRSYQSYNCRVFDIQDKNTNHINVHPNFGTRLDGKDKYSKNDWLTYITKEDPDYIAIGIDVPTYLKEFAKKGSTKMAIIAKDIYDNGLDLGKMCMGHNASVVLLHERKLKTFDSTCKEVKFQHMVPKHIPIDEAWPKCMKKIAKWWNMRCVKGKFTKKNAILYIHSTFYTKGKSTVLMIMCMIMNGDTSFWSFNDKPWQEQFKSYHRMIGVDGLHGPDFPFTLWDALGRNIESTIQQRNTKTGNRFKGPLAFTSNARIQDNYKMIIDGMGNVKKSYNIPSLLERTLSINTMHHELWPLINKFCEVHGIDPEQFKDDDEDYISDED